MTILKPMRRGVVTARGGKTNAKKAEGSDAAATRPRLGVRVLVVSIYVNAILWSIPFVRSMSEAIVLAGCPRWLLGSTGVAFAAAVVACAWYKLRSSAAVASAAAVYGALVAYLRAIPNEIVHLAEYGVLSLLAWWMLAPVAGRRGPWAALVLAFFVGFVDECTQGVTPGRFFDWRDVAVNAIAAAVPIWLAVRGSPGAARGHRPASPR